MPGTGHTLRLRRARYGTHAWDGAWDGTHTSSRFGTDTPGRWYGRRGTHTSGRHTLQVGRGHTLGAGAGPERPADRRKRPPSGRFSVAAPDTGRPGTGHTLGLVRWPGTGHTLRGAEGRYGAIRDPHSQPGATGGAVGEAPWDTHSRSTPGLQGTHAPCRYGTHTLRGAGRSASVRLHVALSKRGSSGNGTRTPRSARWMVTTTTTGRGRIPRSCVPARRPAPSAFDPRFGTMPVNHEPRDVP